MSKANDVFTKAYQQLNPSQKEAVDTIEGPVMVVAGPGTGKTQVLSLRIANILQKTDVDPSGILALTFTESGVRAMRTRLMQLIGTSAYYVHMHTFHGFCSDIINQYPDYFEISPDFQALSDLDRFNIIQNILETHHFDHIKPANSIFHYTQSLLSGIQSLKREGVVPASFAEILKVSEAEYHTLEVEVSKSKRGGKTKLEAMAKELGKNRELLEVYYLYQKALFDMGRFDFEDMINLTLKALTDHPDLLLTLQEQFQYFLVDEYQDTNSAQNQVVDLLASYWGESANIFVVGDSNQSIYRFQGASLENILQFTSRYKKTRIINLSENYRSTQTILDASSGVIQNNRSRLDTILKLDFQALHSQSVDVIPIKVAQFNSDLVEDYFIAISIKKLLDDGVNPSDIAVIFRQNRDSLRLMDMLSKFAIPVSFQGGTNVITDPHVHQLINLLTIISQISSSSEGVDLFTVLNYAFLELDPLDVLKLTRAASQDKIKVIDLLTDPSYKLSDYVDDPAAFSHLINKLSHWSKLAIEQILPDYINSVILQSGFLKYIENHPQASVKLNRLQAFISFASSCYQQNPSITLSQFLLSIGMLEENNLTLEEPQLFADQNAVIFTTAHKAKGLEWEYCFIYQCIDGKWGNVTNRELIKLTPGIIKLQNLDLKEKNEDERRLFYVALTRAKKQVIITSSAKYFKDTKSREAFPSMFVSEIPPELLNVVDTSMSENNLKHDLPQLFISSDNTNTSVKEAIFLHSLIDNNFHLSASALNTYIQCPYRFKLQYLIRVQEEPHSTLLFGSAVHKALELFYHSYQNSGEYPSLNELIDHFKKAISRMPLTDIDRIHRTKQGSEVLSAYYELHQGQFSSPLFLEKWFGGNWKKIFLDNDISLQGKIDRIEIIDQGLKKVRVVDYKTGTPKTLGQVEGSTQDSDGSLKRQLVFYKLLAESDPHFDYQVSEVQLDFVEAPFRFNKLHKHTLVITDDDVAVLKNEARQVMKSIRALQFDKTNNYSICQDCPFKDHCWPENIPINPQQLSLL